MFWLWSGPYQQHDDLRRRWNILHWVRWWLVILIWKWLAVAISMGSSGPSDSFGSAWTWTSCGMLLLWTVWYYFFLCGRYFSLERCAITRRVLWLWSFRPRPLSVEEVCSLFDELLHNLVASRDLLYKYITCIGIPGQVFSICFLFDFHVSIDLPNLLIRSIDLNR